MDDLLEVENLTKRFPVTGGNLIRRQIGQVHAVEGVSFRVGESETVGLVGESGCGKSTTGRMVTRLIEPTSGKITYRGQDITHLNEAQMRPLRKEIQIVFQDPLSSLNPRMTVGSIIGAPLKIQDVGGAADRRRRVEELLSRVGLGKEYFNRYPHEFSGGQRQRIGIARAIALDPRLVVCDEPVSALDVSVQAQIVNLFRDLQTDTGLSYIFIAHDLAVVRQMADRVVVMYLGQVMETARSEDLFAAPLHPYTAALIAASPEAKARKYQRRDRIILHGDLPSAENPPSGCPFRTRCWKATDICAEVVPAKVELAPGHLVACHHPQEVD